MLLLICETLVMYAQSHLCLFFGRYRPGRFFSSNMVNSGISTVSVIMPFNYRSLIDHLGSGKDWNLDRKNGGLFILPDLLWYFSYRSSFPAQRSTFQ